MDTYNDTLVTIVVIAYNQERYIADAVRGVLSQSYSPLEVVISDDNSSDRTFEIIQEKVQGYEGPHRIILNRNVSNLGIIAHINKVILELVQGKYVVIAAGDDVSHDHRVEKLVKTWKRDRVAAVGSNMTVIDGSGKESGLRIPYHRFERTKTISKLSDVIKGGMRRIVIAGATLSFDVDVFKRFGPLPTSVYNEDWIIPFRAVLLGGMGFINEPLVHYRIHGSNIHEYAELRSRAISMDEWLERRRFQLTNQMENYQAMIEDMLKHMKGQPQANVHRAITIFKKKKAMLAVECNLLETAKGKRLRIMKSLFNLRVDLKTCLKMFALLASPAIYALLLRKYLRRQ